MEEAGEFLGIEQFRLPIRWGWLTKTFFVFHPGDLQCHCLQPQRRPLRWVVFCVHLGRMFILEMLLVFGSHACSFLLVQWLHQYSLGCDGHLVTGFKYWLSLVRCRQQMERWNERENVTICVAKNRETSLKMAFPMTSAHQSVWLGKSAERQRALSGCVKTCKDYQAFMSTRQESQNNYCCDMLWLS